MHGREMSFLRFHGSQRSAFAFLPAAFQQTQQCPRPPQELGFTGCCGIPVCLHGVRLPHCSFSCFARLLEGISWVPTCIWLRRMIILSLFGLVLLCTVLLCCGLALQSFWSDWGVGDSGVLVQGKHCVISAVFYFLFFSRKSGFLLSSDSMLNNLHLQIHSSVFFAIHFWFWLRIFWGPKLCVKHTLSK